MSRDKFFDVAEHRFDIARVEGMVTAGILDKLGVRNVRCQFTAKFNRNLRIVLTMENECRNADGWEDRTDINLPIQNRKGFYGSGTSRKPFKLCELSNCVGVGGQAWDNTHHHRTGAPKLHTLL